MIGQMISQYRILEKLGEGGMGIVYKARDTKLDRDVALKFLPPVLSSSDNDRARLQKEARAASSINHSNVCVIHDIDEADGRQFIAMEYVEGIDLEKKIVHENLPVEESVAIGVQIAEGLKAAHERGVVHRDMKSANVMITQKRGDPAAAPQVKIMDFGLAKLPGAARVTSTGAPVGTIAYMSPEQARGDSVDHRTDIWAFGVILYEMVTGSVPFRSEYEQAVIYSLLHESPRPPGEIRKLPSGLEDIILKCLAKDPARRYQTMDEVISGLRLLGSSRPGEPATSSGTATFLFSDIEGSTRLVQELGEKYAVLLADQRRIIRSVIREHNGKEVDTAGDGFFVAFSSARDAVRASLTAQQAVAHHNWPENARVRVRIGIHTGEPVASAEGYVGVSVHKAARLCAVGHGGQILVSATTHALIRDELPKGVRARDLGEHRLKGLSRPEGIYQLVTDDLPGEFPPLKTEGVRINNLPLQPTPLVGREQESQALRALLLRDSVRFVTLTGPGGAGKTRLCIHVANTVLDNFDDGVFFVSLEPLEDHRLVTCTIAQTFSLMEDASRAPVDVIEEFLRGKRMLLVLDNFEQVSAAAPVVARLLAASASLSVLVTSRVPLHLRGEHEFPVTPLSCPDPKQLPPLERLSQYAAVELFIQRAVAVKPDFVVTSENAPAVAGICYRLDGLPLALELAAARVKLFSPQAMLSRLDGSLDLLKGGAKDLPERHQTLREAIAWSYGLLSEGEKALFRRLSAFVGGCDLDAVARVCNAPGVLGVDELDGIAALVDKSLLRRVDHDNGEPRFMMLETIREFAIECARKHEELEVLRRAHVSHYLEFAEHVEPLLTGSDQKLWLNRLEAEHDNFRAVFRWTEETGDGESAVRLAAALWRFWIVRGHMIEGRDRLEYMLQQPDVRAMSRARAAAMNGLGTILHELSEFTRARPHLEESLRIYEQLGDKAGQATVIANLGWIVGMIGEMDLAEKYDNQALALHTALGNKRGMALAFNNLSWLAYMKSDYAQARSFQERSIVLRSHVGDMRGVALGKIVLAWADVVQGKFEDAVSLLEDAASTLRALGDKQILGFAASVRGHAERDRGNPEKAITFLNEGLALSREVGNRWSNAYELCMIGVVLTDMGKYEGARPTLDSALESARQKASPWLTAQVHHALAVLAFCTGEYARSVSLLTESLTAGIRLFDIAGTCSRLDLAARIRAKAGHHTTAAKILGAACKARNKIGTPVPPVETPAHDSLRSLLETSLGRSEFSSAWSEGEAMTLEQAVACAMRDTDLIVASLNR